MLDQFKILCTEKIAPLPTTENLNLCKNFFGFASEKTRLLFFTSKRLLKQILPYNTQLQPNIFVHRWLPTIDQERFFDLPVMPPLFFLNYFPIFPVDVMLVEGRMLCHSRFAGACLYGGAEGAPSPSAKKKKTEPIGRWASFSARPRHRARSCMVDTYARHQGAGFWCVDPLTLYMYIERASAFPCVV